MVRKVTTKPVEDNEAESEDVELLAASDEMAEDSDLDRVITEFGGEDSDAKITVWRVEKNKPKAFCAEYTPADFTLQNVAAAFGAGSYRIEVFARNPKNFNRYSRRASKIVDVAAASASVASPRNVPAQSDVTNIIQQFKEVQESNTRQLVEAMKVQPAKSDLKEWVTMLTPLLAPVLQQLIKPTGRQESLKDQIESLVALKALAGDLAPEKEESDGIMGIGKQVLGILAQGQQQNVTMHEPDAPVAPQLAAPAPAEDGDELAFKLLIGRLAKAADRNSDPSLWADIVEDELSDVYYTTLVEYLASEAHWWPMLCTMSGGLIVERMKPWFDQVRAQLIAPPDDLHQAEAKNE